MKHEIPEMVCREGYWAWSKEPNLPMPANGEEWDGQQDFISALAGLEASLLKQRDAFVTYKGFSTCRLCNKHNGSGEYHHENWQWPQGFIHYVVQHNVRPSLAFQEMVLRKQVK